MVCGIKVVREDTGGLPGTKAALIRTLLRVVDRILGYLVGLLFALSSEERQRLGDMAAHTLWHQRKRAAADRQREAEEKRRRSFKP